MLRAPNAELTGITSQQWRALAAANIGYMLDAADVFLYVFALNLIRRDFGLNYAQSSMAAAFTLLAVAGGGIVWGVLTDRLGRKCTLLYSIMVYSGGSAGTALSTGLWSLLFWRSIVGLGLGGQWAAGAVLVSETWPARHRAKAIGWMQSGWAIGYLMAAAASALILPRWGWRWLFAVGFLPALVAIWIRHGVEEPAIWKHGERPDLRTVSGIFRGVL